MHDDSDDSARGTGVSSRSQNARRDYVHFHVQMLPVVMITFRGPACARDMKPQFSHRRGTYFLV